MSRTLIRGGCVLTLGARTPNHAQADVLVEDGRITEVGPGLRARDAEVVDATDTIVMPGFVDTHRHTWRTLFRNLGAASASAAMPAPEAYGRHYEPDDVYAAVLLGLLSAGETGITTVVDWADIQLDERYTEATLQAHADAGLRTVFVHAVPDWAERPDDGSALRRLLSARGEDPLTTVAFGPSRRELGDAASVAAEWSRARELGLRVHAHAGTTTADRGVVAALAGRGLLGPDVTLVHCTTLGEDDLDAIASHGAAIALTPSSEMAGGLGPPPLQRLIDRGLRPGLGVDDELLSPGDVFAQMRAVQSVQHATLFDLKLAGKGGVPNLLGTREVIRYATVDGARVAGLGAITGSLEVGKQADIVVLRADRPNIAPVNDPIGAVVWGMDPSNVDWVFVAGRAVVRAGEPAGDVARARDLAIRARERVAAAAGDLVGTGAGGGA